ncbi:MAG: hypothetical protein EOO01_23635 [Chitinophagaceae bacterium]|nr:MAG: hypothetical protein EOO01_23635 [Chitinophagaceae bacterium]
MLSNKHITTLALFYLGCALVSFAWFAWHGLTLFQQAPVFFLNKLDISGNALLSTGIANSVISSRTMRFVADAVFLLLPVVLALAVFFKIRLVTFVAILTALFNMAYAYLFSIFTFVSIEVFTAWMFVPLVFASSNIRTNYYLLQIVRIIFLLIFFSTALWKIRAGGLFNPEQLSAILFRQHASLLLSDSSSLFSQLLTFLIGNKAICYTLYLLAFLLEFIFIIGFFTRRYDRLLIACFILFLVFDYLLMEINYFPWTPFLGCLFFSRREEPVHNA